MSHKRVEIQNELDLLQSRYNMELNTYGSKSVERVLSILQEKKENLRLDLPTESYENDVLNTEIGQIFDLIERYAYDIKQIFIRQKIAITHITDVSPNQMIGGKISKSSNRLNNYETEKGDWVFASSAPLDGKNPYIARNPKLGMVFIGDNTYIYGGDNMEVQQGLDGNNTVKLRNSNYIYSINPQRFKPVVTIKRNKDGKAVFDFSEEWVSEQEVDIKDKEQVTNIEKVDDITELVKHYQILCDVYQMGEAFRVRNSHSKEEALNILFDGIVDGNLKYINAEANINVSPLFNQLFEKQYGTTFYDKDGDGISSPGMR